MRKALLTSGALASAAVLIAASASPALAAEDGVVLTDRETVQAYLSPTGEVKVARLYDQVTATGQGTVTVRNPVGTNGLRNLDGMGGVSVRNGNAVTELDVEGESRLRTVSSFDEDDLPVTITPTYELDGDVYEDPEDLVGKSGRLVVTYRVENVTAVPQTIVVQNGRGEDVQTEVEVPLPLVGSLTTVLPRTFYSVRSDQATVTADGRGGTRVTFTMTLLPPVGGLVAEFGYEADVEDAVIPRATASVAVVQPLKYPSLATAAKSYAGGAETGATLTAGAEQIDENLLKLRDGAGELLAGLIQLRDGAQQLNAGLAGEAAPGAAQLADGAGRAADGADELATGLRKAKSGSGDLADGLDQLADGNRQLASGFKSPTGGADLVSGSQSLASGLGLISGGLSQLSSVNGLPKAYAGLQALRFGIDHPIGAGGATDPGGLLQALQQIAGGLSNSGCNPANPTDPKNPCGVKETLASLNAGLTTIKGGLQQVAGGLDNPGCDLTNPANPANPCGVKQGVGAVQAGMADSLKAGGSIDRLVGGLQGAYFFADCSTVAPPGTVVDFPPAPNAPPSPPYTDACDYIEAVYHGIQTGADSLRGRTTQANTGLTGVLGGLDTKLIPGVQQLIGGVTQAQTGLTAIRTGVDRLAAGSAAARDGVKNQVLPGIDQLIAGIASAVTGVNQLSTGAETAATGSGTLAEKIAEAGTGAERLADGSQDAAVGSRQLADGLVAAGTGSRQLADGNRQIADGAGELAAGLGDAADGSGQIADGLEQATDGVPRIRDGAQRLSDEGTSQLVEAGNDTALQFGTNYALLEAMAQRSETEGMPFGAPEGAQGTAAYSFELAAATNEGSRNMTRGLLALAALGVGALVSTFVRGRLAG